MSVPSLTVVVPEYCWAAENSSRPAPFLVTLPSFQMVPVTFRSLVASEPVATLKIAFCPLRLKPLLSGPLLVPLMMFRAPPLVVKVLLPMNTVPPAPEEMASIVPPPVLSKANVLPLKL